MKQPSINIEEKIDRFVGRRTKSPGRIVIGWEPKSGRNCLAESFGGVRIPRGVYRFKTHEEADAWLWRMIARPTKN